MDQLSILPYMTLLAVFMCQVRGQETTVGQVVRSTSTESPFRLHISHVKSSTSTVEIEWYVPNEYELEKYYIQANRNESEGYMRSTYLPTNVTSYEIEDLMTNSKYQVCIYATVTGKQNLNYVECIDTFTIPLMRNDSIIVLCCVIGYLLLMVLIGYLCWRRAHNKKEAEMEEEEDDDDRTRENGDQSKPILLVTPPATGRPRSVIEDDADIPYITPTWDQIEKENQLRARQGHQ